MHELLLHHYPASPYAEKARLLLGRKGLGWRSVTIPMQLPKPDLIALTGGYRKTPVLQVGRDVICDTALIARVLDRLVPTPALVPQGLKASCAAFEKLEQTLFFAAIPTVFQLAGLKALAERLGPDGLTRLAQDRAAMYVGGSQTRPGPEFAKTHFLPIVNALDQQLAASPYLLGDEPTLADISLFHPVWFVRGNPGVGGQLDGFRNLLAWYARMQAIGHGSPVEASADEALSIAKASTDWLPLDGPLLEPDGVKLGMDVLLAATDYGVDPVQGRLVHASVFELVVARTDARAGEVRIHAPRSGFKLTAVAAG
jgi:glutathione S-transferase